MIRRATRPHGPATLALVLNLVALVGCGPPLRVQAVAPERFYRDQVRNVLSGDDMSELTRTALRRHDLLETYDYDPKGAIATLREEVLRDSASDNDFFALAELSLLYAKENDSPSDYLAAALYAYAFLFPTDPKRRPASFDPRGRAACDLYNHALGQALRTLKNESVEPRGGKFPLPFGDIDVAFDPASLDFLGFQLKDLDLVSELEIDGLRNRYRQPGLGVPLSARPSPPDGKYRDDALIGPNSRVPVTAILRLNRPRAQLATGHVKARLDLFATDLVRTVRIGDQELPLEAEPTAVLASTLAASRFWEIELSMFLGNALPFATNPSFLRALVPYTPGKIPVVFVHGTASSPGRWGDMVNDLWDDPRIREHYQFWFFSYDSGNPIVYSAYRLRKLLRDQVAALDPEGRDSALQQMVVIGHSQGGLLTKMTAIDSGDRFWRNSSRKPFSEAKISAESRALLSEALFVKPLPFVKRVIFLATPHHGSFLASPELLRRVVAKLVRLPTDLLNVSVELTGVLSDNDTYMSQEWLPTSIDNMTPGHPFIRALSQTEIDPGIAAHSVIGVTQTGDMTEGDDGVVAYRSAHIDGVESELVVRSGHSMQSNPNVVAEVRRILLKHLEGP